MLRLILIRHGHVEGILPERFRGRLELPLTTLGRAQATATAQRIAQAWRPSAIYTSPMQRCIDTGKAISLTTSAPATPIGDLADLDYGAWTGRTWEEVRAEQPEAYDLWFERPEMARARWGGHFARSGASHSRGPARPGRAPPGPDGRHGRSRQHQPGAPPPAPRPAAQRLLAHRAEPVRRERGSDRARSHPGAAPERDRPPRNVAGRPESLQRRLKGEKNSARPPSAISMSSRRLYLASRSPRHGAPDLSWPPPMATAKSATKLSQVSPERWENL